MFKSRVQIFLSLACVITLCWSSASAQYSRTHFHMTTGNGHGFQVFDRNAGKLTDFLEAPYRFLAPVDGARNGGVGRRDLAHDIYFGLNINGAAVWLNELNNVRYEAESHIIRAITQVEGAQVDVRYFAPFGLGANAMMMMITVNNQSDAPLNVSAFAKPNLKLGAWSNNRVDPGDAGETLDWNGARGIETGPGGGHALYLPVGGIDSVDCGSDAALYNQVLNSGQLGRGADNKNCTGDAQVFVFGKNMTVAPGDEGWWGLGILFVNDNPADIQAADFKDDRTPEDVLAAWATFAGELEPKAIFQRAFDEFEAWRIPPSSLGLTELSPDEITLWRQSESVLRMGQILEPVQNNRNNHGMFLAALPIGEWHTGWVRDGAYGIVAQAMNGHVDEARMGVDFLLNAGAGFFSDNNHLGRGYRISAVRYYGNGKEEGDYESDGWNVETDGFGLTLWAARAYAHYSCDRDWLDATTSQGDTVFEALKEVADDIVAFMAPNDLPGPECSIWEVHWDNRESFTYTAATQIRGLNDFAAIADWYGEPEMADIYRDRANAMLAASKRLLVNTEEQSFASHQGAANRDAFVDGSTVEMLAWDLIAVDDPIFTGTLEEYDRLRTPGGGYRRLEPRLSLRGQMGANLYDLSEWVLLNLRIGEVFRKWGNADRADELLDTVTEAATSNDFLVPELYDPDQRGVYEGVIPMVGYGAGAWQMAQLEKAGYYFPAVTQGLEHCSAPNTVDVPMPGRDSDEEASETSSPETSTPSETNGSTQTPGTNSSDTDTVSRTPQTATAAAPGDPSAEDPFAEDEAAALCSVNPAVVNPTTWVFVLLILWGLLRRNRSRTHG